jgi:NAD(P)-dependent dehydrogenase (short-subunit alcohol dehydrogenase family)
MNSELLSGKIALVTGSTRGLGRAIAHRLATAGADLILHDIDPGQASVYGEASGPDTVIGEMAALGRRCAVVYGNLCDPAAARAIAEQALAHFGRIDVLVNCAGGDIGASGRKPVPNECVGIPDEDLRVILDRNLVSVMNMSRAIAPSMIERGEGRIVNISSSAGMVACEEGSIYAVAKAGVLHWTRCLAKQLRTHGITVNAISPGQTRTARFLVTRHVPEEQLNDQGTLTRLGEPDDVAKVVLFFASDLAAYVTGQNLEVSGKCL